LKEIVWGGETELISVMSMLTGTFGSQARLETVVVCPDNIELRYGKPFVVSAT
jgi:hypothetical protein